MSTGERYAAAKALFLEALDHEPGAQADYVRAKAGDEELAREVLSLLAHHEGAPVLRDRTETPESLARPVSGGDPLKAAGAVIDGRYRVERYVDEGGFSFVYKAEHVLWKRPVALKFFKARRGGASDELQAAFHREGALMNDLARRAPAIVQSFDVGAWASPRGSTFPFTVLEWLDGETLAGRLRRERDGEAWGWPIERVVATLTPIAEALAVVHARGVAHRDIKPSNIFLADDAGKSRARLLDFGVAKIAGGGGFETTNSAISGCTIAYAAPEQLSRAHGSTGPWTDVHALAFVCVELLLGSHPYGADDNTEMMLRTCSTTARPTPRTVGLTASDEVERIFARALALKPQERYPDAGAFWRELQALVAPSRAMSSMVHAATERDVTTVPPAQIPARRRSRVGLRLALGAALPLAALVGYRATRPSAPVEPALASTIEPERLQSFGPLPATMHSETNPLTDAKTRLGRSLFWEPLLSRDRDMSCASCHDLGRGGTDGRKLAIGAGRQEGARNTLSVLNCADAFALMWDGAAQDIEHQATQPITNPREMAMSEDDVVRRLRAVPAYDEAFRSAFAGEAQPVTLANVGRAIGAFERQLATPSRWDAYLEGKTDAITTREREGFNAFVDTGCVTCHFGPYVGLTMFQKLGLVQKWPNERDRGRYELTKRQSDWMVFRVPSLRNVSKTGPYFHDGSVDELDEAVRRMARHQLGKELSPARVEAIVAWLGTLSGDLPEALGARPAPLAAR